MSPVLHVRAFQDNYIWLIPNAAHTQIAAVDPGDARPVLDFLESNGLSLAAVLCTHHHPDHVGGATALRQRFDVPVYGPAAESIAAVTHPVREGDTVSLAALDVEYRVIEIPGHTRGHIAFVNEDSLFCGDTMFSAGCGRLFEGTPEQMHHSLSRLADLPEATAVYCGHEYTLANLSFALAVEPGNPEILAIRREAEAQRARNEPTLPSTVGRERHINPFLRTSNAAVKAAAQKQAGEPLHDEVAVFAALRRWKDGYRG